MYGEYALFGLLRRRGMPVAPPSTVSVRLALAGLAGHTRLEDSFKTREALDIMAVTEAWAMSLARRRIAFSIL